MTFAQTMLVHDILLASRSNGPGLRTVIWTQGCTLGCPGCFNPQTHTFNSGNRIKVKDLVTQTITSAVGIQGITISGGEPFLQVPALAEFLKELRRLTSLSIIVFSGFTLEELILQSNTSACLENIDVLIAGRYEAQHRRAVGLIGSSNKKFHFLTRRYQQADFEMVPEAEVWITPDGTMVRTGIQPLRWPS